MRNEIWALGLSIVCRLSALEHSVICARSNPNSIELEPEDQKQNKTKTHKILKKKKKGVKLDSILEKLNNTTV